MEKAMATHSSTLAWKIPWTEEPGGQQSMRSWRVRQDWATSLSCIGEGNGNPLQCSCLENPRDGGAWWAAVCGVAQSRTRLKRLSSSSSKVVRVPPDHFLRHTSWDNLSTRWARENRLWVTPVSGQGILLLCNQGYTSWETGSQARFVTIIIIKVESEKRHCAVWSLVPGSKERPVLGQETLLRKA